MDGRGSSDEGKMPPAETPANRLRLPTTSMDLTQRSGRRWRPSADCEPISPAVSEWCEKVALMGCDGMRREYTRLRKYVAPDLRAPSFHRYGASNRYRDVLCIEKTRVRLGGGSGGDSYIHANYVAGSKSDKQFICTQAPMHETVGDFWRMVCQEGTNRIIMLSEWNEVKAFQYLPSNPGRPVTVGDYTIRLTRRAHKDDIITSQLVVTAAGLARAVTHFQFGKWPTHGVPSVDDTGAVLRLLHVARSSGAPVVVHCTAGIGRTGTFVVAELAIGVCRVGFAPDVPELLKWARSQRAHCVQSEQQYLFIYRLVIHWTIDNFKDIAEVQQLNQVVTDLPLATSHWSLV